MSRINKEVIWNEWVGKEVKKILCPCCKEIYIRRDPHNNKYDWVKGHLIPAKGDPENGKLPPDFVENLQPICYRCNEADKDERFPTNLHYRVHLGVLTTEECEEWLGRIRSIIYGSIRKCLAVKSNGKNCDSRVHGKQLFCGTHVANSDQHLKTYQQNIIEKDIALMKSNLKLVLEDGDDFEVETLDEMIYELRQLRISS